MSKRFIFFVDSKRSSKHKGGMGFLWFQNGKPPIKITETTTEIEELRSRLEAEKKMRKDVEKELELQVDDDCIS